MADKQPPTVVEGATTGDVEDELPSATAKSAEDRKAASALASLDANSSSSANDDASARNVDHDAVSKAIKSLSGGGASGGSSLKKSSTAGASTASSSSAVPARAVKVDAADVALVVDQLELTKPKATELLKAHDGDAVKAMSAFVAS
ncbi:hypothetical protein JDV02_009474 [Purpureocillium takamizusanense]|uniref:Nascent polypeptide-associated complex subunit alpha-like UBA domain-containing protein n=1 Tax=Purpureocillium takamizusanense TaxID=2060973 RepID=A0A9Q8QNY4_9HYPO|nr:uncharacterized protein JDV02_009474 [Purpureocillium takamizusanense]UNI23668.1 hypothetical protein JDV02_009474 [Purpureocillium takamizusanense]